MSELEDLLRAKAKTGALHGVTLFPSGSCWQGNVRYDSDGWRVEHHDDPVEALLAALRDDTPPAPTPAASGGIFD